MFYYVYNKELIIMKLVKYPDPILRKKTEKVKEFNIKRWMAKNYERKFPFRTFSKNRGFWNVIEGKLIVARKF